MRSGSPEDARGRLRHEVGGFFSNTSRGPDRCPVCTGPTSTGRCSACAVHRQRYDGRLADLVVPLAYAKGNMSPRHQSEFHMFRYKHRINPSQECRRDLKLMVRTAMSLHGECIVRTVGRWGAVTFVPSESRPDTGHPVVELAQQVTPFSADAARILLGIGPDITVEPRRTPLPGRFVVGGKWRPRIRDQHVLVVDDTWVSGAKAQSAAIALKDAGAVAVTILCVARWLSWDLSSSNRDLIRSLDVPYDALRCPVTGADCPGGQ